MSLLIRGLGTARPPHTITQAAMAQAALPCSAATLRQRKLLPALYRRAQVDQRHIAVLNRGDSPPPVTNIGTESGQLSPPEPALSLDADTLHRRMLAAYPPTHDVPTEPPAAGGNEQADAVGAQVEAVPDPTVGQRLKRYPDEALNLAAAACRAALADAALDPQDIGQLVVVSCTGFSAPGVDIGLIDALGLPPTVGRTTVGFMGCHGAMNGLRVARGLSDSFLDPGKSVLMCCVELCSLHFQYGWDPQKVVANALFSDGAAAVVGDTSPSAQTASISNTKNAKFIVSAHGSCIVPDSRDAMTWLIRDHGFEMTLSPRVPDLIHRHLRMWLEAWLAEQGLAVEAINGWAIHPGGPRVISAVEEALKLASDAGNVSRHILRTHGNMSSPTVLFILDHLRQLATPRPWVTLAFGPGLTIEAVLIR